MSKYLLYVHLVIATAILGVIYKPSARVNKPETVTKNVSFIIFKENTYTSPAYDNTSAEIQIIVQKVNTQGAHIIVLDTILQPKYLSQYPTLDEAVTETVTVPNVNTRKEHLEVTYVLTYNSAGNILQMQRGEVISEESTQKVEIPI